MYLKWNDMELYLFSLYVYFNFFYFKIINDLIIYLTEIQQFKSNFCMIFFVLMRFDVGSKNIISIKINRLNTNSKSVFCNNKN